MLPTLFVSALACFGGVVQDSAPAQPATQPDEIRAVWTELLPSPLFARDAVRAWRGEYRSLGKYEAPHDENGAPRWVQNEGGPVVSRFELVETSFGPEHQISVKSLGHAADHARYSFARGVQYWKRTEELDAVLYEDKKVAQRGQVALDMRLRPRDLPSPLDFLTELLAKSPEVWASKVLGGWNNDGQVPIGRIGPLHVSSIPREDKQDNLVAIRERVEAQDVRFRGEPVFLQRDIFYDPTSNFLPVMVEFRFNASVRHRWRLTWVAAAAQSAPHMVVRGHTLRTVECDGVDHANQLVTTQTMFELLEARLLTGQEALPALAVRIPDDYEIVDLDARR